MKLLDKTNGYKTILGALIVVIGALTSMWGVTAGFSTYIINIGLGLMGVGLTHKLYKRKQRKDHDIVLLKKYSVDNIDEIIIALVSTVNLVDRIAKEELTYKDFLDKHLFEFLDLIPVILLAIEGSKEIKYELKNITKEREFEIASKLDELDLSTNQKQLIVRNAIKLLLDIAIIGFNIK